MSAERTFFRYSRADAILAVAGAGHVAFLLWTFLAFSSLPWWATGLSSRDGRFRFFRVGVTPVIRVALKYGKGNVAQVAVGAVVLAIFWAAMALVNGRYFCYFYLPSFFFGWVLSYAEGYLEHHG